MFESVLGNTAVSKILEIEVDGVQLSLDEPFEGIVVVNLPSYAGGCNLWGTEADDKFRLQSINDGLIEVVGIRNTGHLAQIRNDVPGVRLAQGKNIKIYHKTNQSSKTTKFKPTPVAMQVDGEPWEQKNVTIVEVNFFNQSSMLARYMVQ